MPLVPAKAQTAGHFSKQPPASAHTALVQPAALNLDQRAAEELLPVRPIEEPLARPQFLALVAAQTQSYE